MPRARSVQALSLTVVRLQQFYVPGSGGSMAATDVAKYLDERGTKILANESQLRDLGLLVEKTRVGQLSPSGVSGGILDVISFDQFKKRDERFRDKLVDFL